LEVPLDYAEPSIGTINIAIIKKPGATEDSQEILVNPGGPGGSSVAFILQGYAGIQEKVGSEYSLVGIDPRGVNNSGPSSDCFPGYPFPARNAFAADVSALADVESEYVMRQQHQALLAYGKWCTDIFSVNGTAKYANTVATAEDMLHYIELRARDLGQPAEEAKLWYYGVSYGSVLGMTFASLHPSRIGRMIIDGVVNLQEYYAGKVVSSADDSDKAAQYFFKRCFEAGPLVCSFHQNATSWQEIETRYQDLLHTVKESPIGLGYPLSNASQTAAEIGMPVMPSVLKWTDIVSYMYSTLYNQDPLQFYAADLGLVALQTGNYELLSAVPENARITYMYPDYDERMALTLIGCSDSNGRTNMTDFEGYKNHVEFMYEKSEYGGLSVAAWSGLICSQFNVQPPASQTFDGIPKIDNTSAPILFISGIADPITPLSAARKSHDIFQGSGLLLFNDSGVSYLSTHVKIQDEQYANDCSTPRTLAKRLVWLSTRRSTCFMVLFPRRTLPVKWMNQIRLLLWQNCWVPDLQRRRDTME
jgi:pimeloyl-ACP methyl ester carboxylesterase